MFIDSSLEIADALALNTGAAGGYLIGNQIDLGAVQRDIGIGKPLFLVIAVDTDVDSAGNGATVEFELRSDATAAVDPTTGTCHFRSGAIPQASLTAGKIFAWQLPPEGLAYERFLGLIQRTAVEAVTAGKINAFLTTEPGIWHAVADAQH